MIEISIKFFVVWSNSFELISCGFSSENVWFELNSSEISGNSVICSDLIRRTRKGENKNRIISQICAFLDEKKIKVNVKERSFFEKWFVLARKFG